MFQKYRRIVKNETNNLQISNTRMTFLLIFLFTYNLQIM